MFGMTDEWQETPFATKADRTCLLGKAICWRKKGRVGQRSHAIDGPATVIGLRGRNLLVDYWGRTDWLYVGDLAAVLEQARVAGKVE
jgi:hypothetical protein